MSKRVKRPTKLVVYEKDHSKLNASDRLREELEKMALTRKMTCLTGLLIIGLLGLFGVGKSDPNTNVTNVLCNSGVYAEGDPFAISLAYILSDIEAYTAKSKGYDYHNISPYPNAFAYGHGVCNQNLTSFNCGICLNASKTAMFGTCVNRIGSRSVLYDCSIRYEQYPFDD